MVLHAMTIVDLSVLHYPQASDQVHRQARMRLCKDTDSGETKSDLYGELLAPGIHIICLNAGCHVYLH